RVVPRYGYRLELLDIEGFKGKRLFNKVSAGIKVGKAILSAVKILKSFEPDGVVGTGGYSSAPVVMAARLLKIKTAILEQNTIPGLTNRILGRFVNIIFIAFEESKRFFPAGRVVLAGNPIRKELLKTRANREGEKFSILVFGGSQGAKAINTAFLDAMEYLADIRDSLRVIHQTGDADYTMVKETYERKDIKADIFRFIDDMSSVYASTDLVICRGGATSIAEVAALGLAAILIPYPFSANNHQEINTRCLADKGAAVMLKQDEIIGDALASLIRRFYENPDELESMQKKALAFGKPNAAEEIVGSILRMLNWRLQNAN
ncbi:MAG: undecaprenyldiphospho-muramoylpentapeptide beta-N-acetylglucosaminyltransferase, partial [Deltaproteobacteria bacterium]|nr:undecaprenyldiphospho-muramoylpentapeptide beta-N-acetylglucosaminyltransferase [Deltaproteobacteria bacterium]